MRTRLAHFCNVIIFATSYFSGTLACSKISYDLSNDKNLNVSLLSAALYAFLYIFYTVSNGMLFNWSRPLTVCSMVLNAWIYFGNDLFNHYGWNLKISFHVRLLLYCIAYLSLLLISICTKRKRRKTLNIFYNKMGIRVFLFLLFIFEIFIFVSPNRKYSLKIFEFDGSTLLIYPGPFKAALVLLILNFGFFIVFKLFYLLLNKNKSLNKGKKVIFIDDYFVPNIDSNLVPFEKNSLYLISSLSASISLIFIASTENSEIIKQLYTVYGAIAFSIVIAYSLPITTVFNDDGYRIIPKQSLTSWWNDIIQPYKTDDKEKKRNFYIDSLIFIILVITYIGGSVYCFTLSVFIAWLILIIMILGLIID